MSSTLLAEDSTDATKSGHLFLNASTLTNIQPLTIHFHKGQEFVADNNQDVIRAWAEKLKKSHIPINIYSYALLPTGIRDLTADRAKHQAVRIAFNRGMAAKNILEQSGIQADRIFLKAGGPDQSTDSGYMTITIRRD